MNKPFRMYMTKMDGKTVTEVDVYDFIHDINDTFHTLVLCWVIKDKYWTTVPITYLFPKEDN